MPQVLTTNAIITCPHGGPGTSVPTNPKWSVNGGFVLLENDAGVLACPAIPPCVGYQLRSMGLNATQIDGRKVMLVTDFNQSLTGLPLLMVETHQTFDDSTPTPIPAGGAAPPLSPALADAIAPVVSVVPPALAFVTAPTPTPPTALATFTLVSDFPLSWKLVVLSSPAGFDSDITNDPPPPGLLVAPSGGSWTTPVLVVTMTMTAAFMASLGIGLHTFYMTGVNQRGLTGFEKMELTVS